MAFVKKLIKIVAIIGIPIAILGVVKGMKSKGAVDDKIAVEEIKAKIDELEDEMEKEIEEGENRSVEIIADIKERLDILNERLEMRIAHD